MKLRDDKAKFRETFRKAVEPEAIALPILLQI